MVNVHFLKMTFMVHCNFKKGSQNQYFQSTLLVGRGSQKEYYVYALDNVDNSGMNTKGQFSVHECEAM